MVSVLRQLQAQWNDLVPMARERGIPRVRFLHGTLEPIAYRRERLERLREQLGITSSHTTAHEIVAQQSDSALDAFTFGVEIECIRPRGITIPMVAAAITRAGVVCNDETYNHSLRTNWKAVTDASIGYDHGVEIVSPPLRGEEGFHQLRKVCDELVRLRCKVNKSCGFHVHVGARGMPVSFFRNLVVLYYSAQGAIDTFMSPSRRANTNGFCQPVRLSMSGVQAAATVAQVMEASNQSSSVTDARGSRRYRKLNLQSYLQHGTVEFRHHQGTVEAIKAEHWTRLCLRMALLARDGVVSRFTSMDLESFFSLVGASEREQSYFYGRVEHFARLEGRTVEMPALNRFTMTMPALNHPLEGVRRPGWTDTRETIDPVVVEANSFIAAGDDMAQRARTRNQF